MPAAFLRQAQRHKPDLLRPFADLPLPEGLVMLSPSRGDANLTELHPRIYEKVFAKLLGSQDAAPLEFWVGVAEKAVVQLDDMVAEEPIADVAERTADEYGILISQLVEQRGFRCQQISAIAVACVVPPMLTTAKNATMVCAMFGK